MKSKKSGWTRKVTLMFWVFLGSEAAFAQAVVSMPEWSPVKLLILFVLDSYGVWKLLGCVKNVFDHLAESSRGDTTAKDRVWNSVLSFVGILLVGVVVNVLILKAGEFGARPVSSVLSGN